MNRASCLLFAFCLTALTGCLTPTSADRDARSAAVEWLAVVDSGNYHKAYLDRPPRILAGSKEEDFLRFMNGRRAPLGKPKTRAFFRVSYTKTLIGSPDGNYGLMFFKTNFEHKANSYEGVTVTGESGHWQVSGYSIR